MRRRVIDQSAHEGGERAIERVAQLPTSDIAQDSLEHVDRLAGEVVTLIHQLESALVQILGQVNVTAATVASERTNIERDREEIDILYSLEHPDDGETDAPGTQRLRDREDELLQVELVTRALARGISDFVSVLAVAARQLDTNRQLPDTSTSHQVAVRMAELRAREEERRRFARDVHDGPAQAFANAIIGLEFVERAIRSGGEHHTDDSLAEIERIKGAMREGLTEIRRFIFDNRPTMLNDRGLVPTIRHYVQSYQAIFPMVIRVEAQDDIPRLAGELELTAFRTIQESIQNASKHARASRVNVVIAVDDDQLVISIADNGRGFDPERVTSHAMGGAGLRGMEERAELAGGTLEILSERGEGTTINLRLPLMLADDSGESA